ncbi:HAMP domain-containing sensor histidine kinase [Aeromicrobium sp.]|uniref:HAMP domain-containing sensor histidine kinase n=1 Tax=Aeromicrobium sp. TaxID=1871063 RepID=UPI0019A49155|nr:HAMP domain-containing sensor histidine kinase [Aeromicrobium sp.]MBC7630496.1 HAMP domain-containing histidine kinase [Aeromicrobium sp.]
MTLRRRILLLATGLTALVLVLFAVPLAIALKQSTSDRVVRESEYVTQGVADFLSTYSYTKTQTSKYVDRVNSRTDTAVTVFLPSGASVGAALPGGVKSPTKMDGSGANNAGDGDGDRDNLGKVSEPQVRRATDGWVIEIQSTSPSGRALVLGYINDKSVNRELYGRWGLVAGGALLLLVLSAGGAEIVSRRLTRPLVATATTAAELGAGRLDARAPVDGAPEIAQVATALNLLADRIETLLASERETIADLSHRLRTPMTAIRLDVEALPDSERVRDLGRHVAALERTLTAVIQHSRLPQRERDQHRCDAREVLLDRVIFWTPLAEDQSRQVDVERPDDAVEVGCTAEELSAAIDALIENVIAHTPEGTPLSVVLVRTDSGAQIDVIDRGPGIPLGATRRGRSDRGSSGLGLDIARSCAESTGGRLDVLSNDDGTNTVRLDLHAPHSNI